MCRSAEAFAIAGEKEKAAQLLQQAIARQEKLGSAMGRGCTAYNYATVYAALGDRAAMLRTLEEAERQIDMKSGWVVVDPVFDAYRSDREFKEIVRRITTPR